MRKQIIEVIKEALESIVEEGSKVMFREVIKNNGVKLQAVVICKPGESVSPTIYIDRYIDDIEQGIATPLGIAHIIVAEMETATEKSEVNDIVSKINKETILADVEYQLVNKEKNKEMLVGKPHKEFMDLAVVYRVVVSADETSIGSFMVSNGVMDAYNIDIDELDHAARRNTENFDVRTMSSIMSEMTGLPEENFGDMKMYILGNKRNVNGATIMLYAKYFEELSNKLDDDLYIMPSSIHECIAVPASGMNSDDLRQMVSEVNATQVSDDEVLSDTVYRYSREDGTLKIA